MHDGTNLADDLTTGLLSIMGSSEQYSVLFLLGVHKSVWNATLMHIKGEIMRYTFAKQSEHVGIKAVCDYNDAIQQHQ